MPGPVRTRAACDRCHSQKLRCHKDAGSTTCARCVRAGAVCVFSPPGRSGAAQRSESTDRPAGIASTATAAAGAGAGAGPFTPDQPSGGSDQLVGALEWPFMYDGLSLDDLMKIPTPSSSAESHLGVGVRDALGSEPPAAALGEAMLRPARETSGDPVAAEDHHLTTSQRLTKLMGDADSVVASLPPCSVLHVSSDTSDQIGAEFSTKYFHNNYMAQMFNVIQRLVDEYPKLIQMLKQPPGDPDESCDTPNCLHRVELPPPFAWLAGAAARRLDVAAVNLLISSHVRLLDALDRTFTCAATCFRATMMSPTLTEPEFIISPIQIGSFVPSKGSSAMVQLFLLKHLLSILSNRIQQLIDFLKSAGFEERETQCLMLQIELLRDRHEGIGTHLASFEAAAAQLGLMK